MRENSSYALKEVGRVVTGRTPSTSNESFYGGDIPFITPTELDQDQPIACAQRNLTKLGAEEVNLLPANAVLICCIGSLGKIGMNAVPAAFNQQINAIIFDERKVIPKYGYYACSMLRNKLKSLAPATTVPIINKSKFENIKIPVPSIEEQNRLVKIFDQVGSIKTKRNQTIERINSLSQAIFLEMFGDPVTNPKKFDLLKFEEVGKLDRGVSKHRPRNAPELLGGKYPLIQTGDVANSGGYITNYTATYSDIGLKQSKIWPKGTLCITIAANIAKTGILQFDACFPDSVVAFQSEKPELVEYVRLWLSFLQKKLEAEAPESAQKNINLGILRDLKIPFPPEPLLLDFYEKLMQINSILKNILSAANESVRLAESLQSKLFSEGSDGSC